MHASCWLAASGDLGAGEGNDGYCGLWWEKKRWCGRCSLVVYKHNTEVEHVLVQQDRQGVVHSTVVGCAKAPVLGGSVAQEDGPGSPRLSGRCDTSRPMKLPPSHPNQKSTLPCPRTAVLLGGCHYFTRHALPLRTRLCTI